MRYFRRRGRPLFHKWKKLKNVNTSETCRGQDDLFRETPTVVRGESTLTTISKCTPLEPFSLKPVLLESRRGSMYVECGW